MEDAGSNKQRQATRVFKKSSPNGKVCSHAFISCPRDHNVQKNREAHPVDLRAVDATMRSVSP